FRFRHGKGGHIWVRSRGLASWDREGMPVQVAGSLEDISQRIEHERQLAAQAEALERKNEELERFAILASHDLQEPLRKISGFGELLVQKYAPNLDERGRQYIAIMSSSAQRLQRLIDDLLRYSRSSNAPLARREVDLAAVLEQVRDNCSTLVAENAGRIEHSGLPCLKADPGLMEHLFQNLVSNALRYRSEASPVVEIRAERKDDEWWISVADNGVGFPPEQAERIFDMFHRLGGRDRDAGSGIGLAICRRIAERHGGRIWATSEPGKGSCFTLALPVKAG
ncbi:sensor histidine kinase, partial [Maricaulis sp. CAU 1757]